MPHESLVLSLKIFDDIETWASSKHDAFALRVLLGHLIDIASVDDIYEVFSVYDAIDVYEEMCCRGVGFDRRVRIIDAVLRLFANTPILAKRFPRRRKEWMLLKDLVDAEERERFIKGKGGGQWLNAVTGLLHDTATEFDQGMSQMNKLGFSTAEKRCVVNSVLAEISEMFDYAPKDAKKRADIWTRHLKMLQLFDPDDATEDEGGASEYEDADKAATEKVDPVTKGDNAFQNQEEDAAASN